MSVLIFFSVFFCFNRDVRLAHRQWLLSGNLLAMFFLNRQCVLVVMFVFVV